MHRQETQVPWEAYNGEKISKTFSNRLKTCAQLKGLGTTQKWEEEGGWHVLEKYKPEAAAISAKKLKCCMQQNSLPTALKKHGISS